MVQGDEMPIFMVKTPQHAYQNVVERGVLRRIAEFMPPRVGKVFVVTTEDVWRLHGEKLKAQFDNKALEIIFFPGGEANKRLSCVEALAEQMVDRAADRTSMVIGFGGGIVTDISGFLAAIFMRGIPILQIPTTLLAQVDAGTGGKTGVNLVSGKNLIGSFHQPTAVLIDPDLLSTLSPREYRAGLFEVVKAGIIRDRDLFDLLEHHRDEVLALRPAVTDQIISAAVRIKAEVVTADEREGDLRRILNFGHTFGHAIEAETAYVRVLHGEAVGWGMLAATRLAELTGTLKGSDADRIARVVSSYGPLPAIGDLHPDRLLARLSSDKKTMQGKIHFVLPTGIGAVKVISGIDPALIRQAAAEALRKKL
jgi:3-dehydroquinate synthase